MKRWLLFLVVFSASCAASEKAMAPAEESGESEAESAKDEQFSSVTKKAETSTDKKQVVFQLEHLTAGINQFGFDALKYVPKNGNIVFSPYALAHGLVFVSEYTKADTQKQILDTTRITLPESDRVQKMRELNARFRIQSSNLQKRSDFRSYFYAFAGEKNPISDKAISAVDDTTTIFFGPYKGKATDVLNAPFSAHELVDQKPFKTGDISFALNAASNTYLRAPLEKPFVRTSTKLESFEPNSTRHDKKPVQLMRQSNFFDYLKTDTFTAVSLPYADGLLETWIVVPKNDLDSVASAMSAKKFAWIRESAKRRYVDLRVPKFSAKSATDFRPFLTSMGIAHLFDPDQSKGEALSAEGSGFRSWMDVASFSLDEDGTNAKAKPAKAVTGPANPSIVDANKPFMFVVVDKTTQVITLMGTVSDP